MIVQINYLPVLVNDIKISGGRVIATQNTIGGPIFYDWGDKPIRVTCVGVRALGFISGTIDKISEKLGVKTPETIGKVVDKVSDLLKLSDTITFKLGDFLNIVYGGLVIKGKIETIEWSVSTTDMVRKCNFTLIGSVKQTLIGGIGGLGVKTGGGW